MKNNEIKKLEKEIISLNKTIEYKNKTIEDFEEKVNTLDCINKKLFVDNKKLSESLIEYNKRLRNSFAKNKSIEKCIVEKDNEKIKKLEEEINKLNIIIEFLRGN